MLSRTLLGRGLDRYGRHLIRLSVTRPNFLSFNLPSRPVSSYSSSSFHMDAVTQSLAALSLKPTATVSHSATDSPAAWKDALSSTSGVPSSYELIKTLVYKPKTAKTATPVPVVVITRDSTAASSGVIGKRLNLKELRMASEDLLTEFFSLDKDSRMYF
jgi:hypothetical protein